MDELFFWLFAAGMIGFGLAVVLGRNPVASALCFATTMIFMAALFVMLNAFFLAAVQILVTAGAVMVLFLFIIMLLDVNAAEHRPRQRIWMGCTFVLALGFVYLLARVLNANSARALPRRTRWAMRRPPSRFSRMSARANTGRSSPASAASQSPSPSPTTTRTRSAACSSPATSRPLK